MSNVAAAAAAPFSARVVPARHHHINALVAKTDTLLYPVPVLYHLLLWLLLLRRVWVRDHRQRSTSSTSRRCMRSMRNSSTSTSRVCRYRCRYRLVCVRRLGPPRLGMLMLPICMHGRCIWSRMDLTAVMSVRGVGRADLLVLRMREKARDERRDVYGWVCGMIYCWTLADLSCLDLSFFSLIFLLCWSS